MKNQIRRALDIKSGNLIPAQNGIKGNDYICPECNDVAIFCKGKIVKPYYRHRSDSNCTFFERCGESEDHLECKLSFSNLINKGGKIEIFQKCQLCNLDENIQINIKDQCVAVCEEKISNKIHPDITVRNIKNNKIAVLIEIKHTHATNEYSREGFKWTELDARSTLDILDKKNCNGIIFKFYSIRKFKCNSCKEKVLCKLCNKEDKIYDKKYCANCKYSALRKIYNFLKSWIKKIRLIVLNRKLVASQKIINYWKARRIKEEDRAKKNMKKIKIRKEKEHLVYIEQNSCFICKTIDSNSIRKGYCIYCYNKSMKVFLKLKCFKMYFKYIKQKLILKKEEFIKREKKIKYQQIKNQQKIEEDFLLANEKRINYIKKYGKKCKCKILFKKMCFCMNRIISVNAEHCSVCNKFVCKC
tara:strand:- start:66 stop:1310 length:1245 start_codon:yes stop_codon:yes gene_type:complete